MTHSSRHILSTLKYFLLALAVFITPPSCIPCLAEEMPETGGDRIVAQLSEEEDREMQTALKAWTDDTLLAEFQARPLTEEDVKALYSEFAGAIAEPPLPVSGETYEAGKADEAIVRAGLTGKKVHNLFLALSGEDFQKYGRLLGLMRETLCLESLFMGKCAGGDKSACERWYDLHNAGVKETEREYIKIAISSWGVETAEDEDASQNGYGSASLPDGSVYEGNFENGLFNGRGSRTWKDGHKYEGEYKDGLADGNGVETWSDGTRYEGAFKEGKWHGKGVVIWKDGRRFQVENP